MVKNIQRELDRNLALNWAEVSGHFIIYTEDEYTHEPLVRPADVAVSVKWLGCHEEVGGYTSAERLHVYDVRWKRPNEDS